MWPKWLYYDAFRPRLALLGASFRPLSICVCGQARPSSLAKRSTHLLPSRSATLPGPRRSTFTEKPHVPHPEQRSQFIAGTRYGLGETRRRWEWGQFERSPTYLQTFQWTPQCQPTFVGINYSHLSKRKNALAGPCRSCGPFQGPTTPQRPPADAVFGGLHEKEASRGTSAEQTFLRTGH